MQQTSVKGGVKDKARLDERDDPLAIVQETDFWQNLMVNAQTRICPTKWHA